MNGSASRRPHPPVIQDDIRPPHVAAGYADGIQAVVVLLLPGEVGIHPYLPDPQVGSQDLVALILAERKYTLQHEHTQRECVCSAAGCRQQAVTMSMIWERVICSVTLMMWSVSSTGRKALV